MLVIVGSANPGKVNAVQTALGAYGITAEVRGVAAASEVSAQPFGLEQIIQGARNRAVDAFRDCDISVGMESGIFRMHDKHYDTIHVAVYDGTTLYEAAGPYFEIPERIVEEIQRTGLELGHFFDGKGTGAIGFLTQGRITREQQATQGALLAFARWLNKEYC
ncbi:DUF84 family protein [Candidatus Woesearchaeota archaeon]|nr:DUF84 family protein [Candidatus Woesearchaeota archaeon]